MEASLEKVWDSEERDSEKVEANKNSWNGSQEHTANYVEKKGTGRQNALVEVRNQLKPTT